MVHLSIGVYAPQKSLKRNGDCHSKFTKNIAIVVFVISSGKNIEKKEISVLKIVFKT